MGTDRPSFTKTYRRADDDDDPVELVEETWERSSVRTFWHLPTSLYACQVEGQDPCEEDAVGWWQSPDGVWLQVCKTHEVPTGAVAS